MHLLERERDFGGVVLIHLSRNAIKVGTALLADTTATREDEKMRKKKKIRVLILFDEVKLLESLDCFSDDAGGSINVLSGVRTGVGALSIHTRETANTETSSQVDAAEQRSFAKGREKK
jgi:hypothetical protein